MPLRLNVGASQKVGEANYGSRGASVNVEMELDATLISEPARLQEKIRQLFSLVRASLAQELNGGTRNGAAPAPSQSASGPDQGPATSGPRNGSGRLATQSQIKALFAITKSQQLNLNQLVRERFQVARPDDLSIKEASQLIDSLKSARREEG
jgi:hypothetical protein